MTYRVELFCEDSAHESCARATLTRIAGELDVTLTVHVASARFGLGRLTSELKAFQALVQHHAGTPDLLVVLADADDIGPHKRRQQVEEIIDPSVFPSWVVGTPDPCVERWLLADPVSFAEQFDYQPQVRAESRRQWKLLLVDSLEAAGEIVTQGGAEFADEIIGTMDFYRAGKADSTIQKFASEIRSALTASFIAGRHVS